MKPTVKIASLFLAVLMLFSVFASGCSLEKEWAYKTADQELAIGVYLTAMQQAYSQAQSYAKALDDYDDSSDKWLDLEITDGDGNKQVARQWIKDTAERMCLELLVLRPELERIGSSIDEATLTANKESYESNWFSSAKATLEKLGVSVESYTYFMANYATLREQLFNAVYGAGGTQEATTDEITAYLVENYARYGMVPVPLYESTTDEAGDTKDVALSETKVKEITDKLDAIAKQVNDEKDPQKASETATKLIEEYLTAEGLSETVQTQNLTIFKDSLDLVGKDDKELAQALKKLDEGKASTLTIGEEDNEKNCFLLIRYDAENMKANYQSDSVTDNDILKKMKSKDFNAYLKELYDKTGYEKSGSVDKYDPSIFYVKQESSAVTVS